MIKIKPCPHCKDAWLYAFTGDHPIGYEINGYKVNCKCGYAWESTSWHKSREDAIGEWNDIAERRER